MDVWAAFGLVALFGGFGGIANALSTRQLVRASKAR